MTKKIFTLGLVYISLVAALPACKSDGGGAGGSGGGSGGSGSTSTVTGSGGCGQCWPQCFLDMFADCMPSSTCTEEKSGGTNVNQCFDNGVKSSTVIDPATFATTLTYYKSDGSICFAASNSISSSTVTATYKDATGTVILTDTSSLSGGVQTIECGGQTYQVDPNSAACTSCQTGGTGTSCTSGTCSVP